MANELDRRFVVDETGDLAALANNLVQACGELMNNEEIEPVLQIYSVITAEEAHTTENLESGHTRLEQMNTPMNGAAECLPIGEEITKNGEQSHERLEQVDTHNNDAADLLPFDEEINMNGEQSHERLEQANTTINDAEECLPGGEEITLNGEQGQLSGQGDQTVGDEGDVLEAEVVPGTGDAKRGRKRQRQPELWQRTIKKKQRQSGQEYVNSKGVTVEKKSLGVVDCSKCCHKCSEKMSDSDRTNIFNQFWSLSDDGKSAFYCKFTERIYKQRKRTKNETSSREYTILYYLESQGTRYRICKKFFLATLGISQRRINYFYSKLVDQESGVAKERVQGQHCKYMIPDFLTDAVRRHIESFPTVESHYARQKTSQLYLEQGLNLAMMYDLYREQCEEKGVGYVKAHKYREIFNTEYNIGFIKPKTDRCDDCEENKRDIEKGKVLSEEERERIERHCYLKDDANAERRKDRSDGSVVLCFDLENVITLPRANVSNFYYKRKLSVYNLTVHSSVDKAVYCCIWNETESGRGGNSIASALLKALDSFVKAHPAVTSFILWSDSCVPQNRNSMMSYALMSFMKTHPHIEQITQKYSEAGHSLIQEVDNAHSAIDRRLNCCEVFSPVTLIRQLMAVRRTPKLTILQMKHTDFISFDEAKTMKFSKVPYTSVKQLMYKKDLPNFVSYKSCHTAEKEMSCVSILKERRNQRGQRLVAPQAIEPLVSLKTLKAPHSLSMEKVADLTSMIPYMPSIDADYMKTLLKQPVRTPNKSAQSSSK